MNHSFYAVLCTGLLCTQSLWAEVNLGYSVTSAPSASNSVRVGTTKEQGMAICLSHEKLQQLKGLKIVGMNAVKSTRNLTGKKIQAFLSTDLNATPFYAQSDTVLSSHINKWTTTTFDTPYVITGDEPALYMGYTCSTSSLSYAPLSFDKTTARKSGLSFVLNGTQWTDAIDQSMGQSNLQFVLQDAPQFADVILKDIDLSDFFRVDESNPICGQVFNFGTEAIRSLQMTVEVNGEKQGYLITDLNIAPNQAYDFEFPYTTTQEGVSNVKIEVASLNDADCDVDPSDNITTCDICFYPQSLVKTYLFEAFTGQTCTQCAAGHNTIHNALKDRQESIIEVTHHAGYYPDNFTMTEDIQYEVFFNGNTYAPAFMVNRTYCMESSSNGGPVGNVSGTAISAAFENAAKCRPYVSIDMNAIYDQDTKEVTVDVDVYAYESLPAGDHVLNLMLVQDSLISSQANAGSNYVHNRTFRGCPTGNAWGLKFDIEAGQSVTYSKTFELPDTIVSSYEKKVKFPTELSNMYLVAYVANYKQSSANGNEILNCAEVHLSDNVTGIESIKTDAAEVRAKVIGGMIAVSGPCSAYHVFNMAGQVMPQRTTLPRGLYVVSMQCGTKTITQKVMIP